MDAGWLILLFAVVVAAGMLALAVREGREAARTYERIRNLRIPGPEVRVADLDAVDFSVPQPPSQEGCPPHFWKGEPDSEDATSRTYHCQKPYCSRVHTVMR